MAAMIAVGVARTRAQGQNTTSIVTARMISPVTAQVQRGGDQRGHDYPRRPAVGEADDLGLARVGGLHEADHALDGAVLADLGRPHVEGAELVHRAAGDLVARALVHGQALAGHDGLIYRGHAREYDAVDRDRLPGQDAQNDPRRGRFRRG